MGRLVTLKHSMIQNPKLAITSRLGCGCADGCDTPSTIEASCTVILADAACGARPTRGGHHLQALPGGSSARNSTLPKCASPSSRAYVRTCPVTACSQSVASSCHNRDFAVNRRAEWCSSARMLLLEAQFSTSNAAGRIQSCGPCTRSSVRGVHSS
ncbi:hypothetical protein L1887_59351 [Cichorium endivia]|nr:hypothetical protein L1887_59351 [Cichorium endivia]